MPKITCNPSRAREEIETIYERHEALGCHLWSGIKGGIEAHNTHELSLGFNRATPPEIKRALAATLLTVLGSDELEDFIDLLRLAGTEEFFDIL